MTKIAIMQPYLFPYIGYWQLMNTVDIFVSYDDVNYIKKGWINRNNILMGKQAHLLTLSLEKASQNKRINEINICHDINTKEIFLKAIEVSYKKAPFFNTVFPLIQDIMLNKECNIAKFIFYSFQKITQYLDIKTQLMISSDIQKNNNLKGDDKIVHICELLSGTHYINPIGGMDIYHPEKFSAKNIELSFIKSKLEEIRYKQYGNDFISGLSIIDIMMFNSQEDVKKLLNLFSLVKK